MKKILLLLFLISQSAFSQTKEETINWLNTKLEEYGEGDMWGKHKISIKDDPDYGEYLVFTNKIWNPFMKEYTYEYYLFLPKVISSIEVSAKNRTNTTLDIYIISNSQSIYIPEKEKFINEIEIYMKNGNNEMTKRIHKGLLHLIEVMGNRIEPQKELFEN